jgi:putative DNA methylase
MIPRKKLIEVALPLEAINIASAREKSIRHGHPSTLHLWWARRPLAAARAVIFAQMVDDPSSHPDIFRTEKAQEKERQRLFKIIEDLVQWENTTNEVVLERARAEIWQSWRSACADYADHPRAKELFDRHKLPAFHDPFAGGGALPLEAQRLGLESYASDLNPVAVLINKAMIEIPPKFAGRPPVNPEARSKKDLIDREWRGAQGLAADVRYYGKWMRDEAEKRIGHLYPKVEVTVEMAKERLDLKPFVGESLTVIAWLWVRTVICPNPGCRKEMPLLSSLVLSSKASKRIYLVPELGSGTVRFGVSNKAPNDISEPERGFKRGMSGIFECAFCGTITTRDYVADQATSAGFGTIPTAIVAECGRRRIYLDSSFSVLPVSLPIPDLVGLDVELAPNPRDVWCRNFGLKTTQDLFTPRQLVALTTFSDLIKDARSLALQDALCAGLSKEGDSVATGGNGASAYADAVAVYLSFSVSKAADRNSSLCFWESAMDRLRGTFGRQVLPMIWDFAETNPFAGAGGDIYGTAHSVCEVLDNLSSTVHGFASQADAAMQTISGGKLVSSDPPYYDNIAYADLSDYFYVWLRRSVKSLFPDLFQTLAVPKAEELVASHYRHGGKEHAEEFFMSGMTRAMHQLAGLAHPAFPVSIYYAFKQAETEKAGTASTG